MFKFIYFISLYIEIFSSSFAAAAYLEQNPLPKGKKVYMELEMDELSSDILWVGYETIWGDLKDMFDLKSSEIKYIITKWVEDTYNLNVSSLVVEECPSIYFSKL